MTNEEMFQNIESFTVGLDDTFSFHCTQCGKCCIHRTDIILSPRDIFKMAKALKLSNAAVVEALEGLPPQKIHCSVLAEEAVKAALEDYYKRKGLEMPEELKKKAEHKDVHEVQE